MSEQYRLSMEAALDQWKKAASQQGEKIITLQSDLQALRDERDRLRRALLKVKPELYCMDKQLIASGYKRGASVADAIRALEAALTSAGGQERANDSHIG